MKERPILFTGPNVRAILEGWKTQTRRAKGLSVNGMPNDWEIDGENPAENTGFIFKSKIEPSAREIITCPYGVAGDRLWVRETFSVKEPDSSFHSSYIYYRADDDGSTPKWTPSIHMPRWASRITLEILKVRVARLQDISDADCIAEGMPLNKSSIDVPFTGETLPRALFRQSWDKINAKRGHGWATNPWCWCISFRKL